MGDITMDGYLSIVISFYMVNALRMKIFWKEIIEDKVLDQLNNCMIPGSIWVLTADAHYGYSMPVGWAVAYENHISLSWVGFDIWCGNKAVKTNLKVSDIDITQVMHRISREIWFGVGRPNPDPVDHPVLDKIKNAVFAPQRELYELASKQLGTVWSGNHYVDIFKDEEDTIWIWVHFWSRWFGHKTTMMFIAMSQWLQPFDKAHEWPMDGKPILFDMDTQIWKDYFEAMSLAGEYAYAGRDIVCNKVLEILGGVSVEEIHNHHNFARKESHFWRDYYVVRKGCTPAFPWQKWFVGANMADQSVILEWVDSEDSKQWLYSTVHWAGRVMGRNEAAWKKRWRKDRKIREVIREWKVNFDNVKDYMKSKGIELVGAWADEAPECYKSLKEVLAYQWDTVKILHTLTPIWVAMAGEDVYDPYKD